MSKSPIDEDKIREAAYRLWQDEGQPEGRDQDHWTQAVAALTPQEPSAQPSPAPKPARKSAAKAAPKAAKAAAPKPAKPKAAAKPRKPKAE